MRQHHVQSAHQIRTFLVARGLISFVKTTGGKGVHIVVPIQRRHSWDEMKDFTRAVAERLVADNPDR
jgi:bifunctional non-homologous end joining protein LigD